MLPIFIRGLWTRLTDFVAPETPSWMTKFEFENLRKRILELENRPPYPHWTSSLEFESLTKRIKDLETQLACKCQTVAKDIPLTVKKKPTKSVVKGR